MLHRIITNTVTFFIVRIHHFILLRKAQRVFCVCVCVLCELQVNLCDSEMPTLRVRAQHQCVMYLYMKYKFLLVFKVLVMFSIIIRRWDHWQCCVKDCGVVRNDLTHYVNWALYFLFYMTLQLTLTIKREQKLKGSENKVRYWDSESSRTLTLRLPI
jgi:hypothetical protein